MTLIRFWFTVVAALLVILALLAALLAQGGRVWPRLDVLAHIAPLYLAVALAGIVTGAAVADRRARAALSVVSAVTAVAAGVLMAPEYLQRSDKSPPLGNQLKIIQFNAWGGNQTIHAAASWILAEEPDVIVLQEGARLAGVLQAAGFQGRQCHDCGIVILTRLPPLRTYESPPENGVRVFLASVTLQDDWGPYTVIGVHRYWPIRLHRAQVQTEALGKMLAEHHPENLILAGDFNSTPWSFERRREDKAFGLVRRTIALPTWPAARVSHNRLPSPWPYLPIDHLYAGPGWSTVKVERGPRLGSDHYPVVVTLARAGVANGRSQS